MRPLSHYHLVTGTHSRAWDDICQASQVISFMHDLCPLQAEQVKARQVMAGPKIFLFLASLDPHTDKEQTAVAKEEVMSYIYLN